MMATTHAFVGLALAAMVAAAAPEFAVPVAIAGIAGGIFPDLDVFADHRKTLHFPVYYGLAAAVTFPLAALLSNPLTVGITVFLAAAAVHAVSDTIGAGPELQPWAVESDRAVYVHAIGRWARPRRWIRYDGAPEDFLLGAGFAIPGLLVFGSPIRELVAVGLAVSLVYALFRKPIGRRLAPR